MDSCKETFLLKVIISNRFSLLPFLLTTSFPCSHHIITYSPPTFSPHHCLLLSHVLAAPFPAFAMIAHRMLVVAILAIIGHLVRAEGAFRVYGRDETPVYSDSKCYFLNRFACFLTCNTVTGPIIFYNLTKDEFNLRVAQHEQFSGLRKRDVYLLENRNSPIQQKLVDLRTADCQEKYPDENNPYRAIGGFCLGRRSLSHTEETIRTECKQPPGLGKKGRKTLMAFCPEGHP